MSFIDGAQRTKAERGDKESGYLAEVKVRLKLTIAVVNGTYCRAAGC